MLWMVPWKPYPVTHQAVCRTWGPVQVRPEVDGVYGSLVGLMFATLEKLAAADTKHGDRLRWGRGTG